ncbi:MAG TPA: ATP-binding protein [Steroidobacteraceae bacterium]|nr:ATP-binding protein [Steroidobacteraceae bacterium]
MLLAVGVVALGVTLATRQMFEQQDTQHTEALVAQFQREFAHRGQELVRRVKNIADGEATVRMAIDLSRPQADASLYVNDALGLASNHQLDFLELLGSDGAIISSAQWPARFGYRNDWVAQPEDWAARGAFLKREEVPDGTALALLAVSVVRVGDRGLYIVGGENLGPDFLASLVLPAGMRALLYRNLNDTFAPAELLSSTGAVDRGEKFEPLIEQVRKQRSDVEGKIRWSVDAASTEAFHALPLFGRQNELLGVFLVGSSQRGLVQFERRIRLLAGAVAAGGLLLGMLLSWWAAARVTRPVEKLAAGAREVARGNWSARVQIHSRDEIGELASAFNRMTEQLAQQRDRLLQAERVAAWRELARRLAHELKNPLFPLQITVENMRRAREHSPEQFDEVFRESTETLLSELENLKTIVGRFSDFAKMPPPELHPTNVNEIVRGIVKLFEAQFGAVGRPPITPELHLDDSLPVIQADPSLLHRAIENLVLNAMDAMPSGGTLTVRTSRREQAVRIEVSDNGAGLTPEECERLFTPYYTTKQHGTGLGLAIVQSVVSDHGGTIIVESEYGAGTTFRIELPIHPPARPAVAPAAPAAAAVSVTVPSENAPGGEA